MTDLSAEHWYPTAAYLYVLHLDGPALAWEYLRRNPGYRRDWLRRRRRPDAAQAWGLRLLEDPALDARDAHPAWFPDHDAVVQIYPDADPPPEAHAFEFWRVPGRKQLIHDGKRLVLVSHWPGCCLRLALAPGLEDGMAYLYAIVNDMSEVNIDAALVREGGAELSRTDEKLVEMSNGCICCTLREDLLLEVDRLAKEGRFDQLVIESTGISEPLPVAETFTFEGEDGRSLGEVARLDTMVTVVDAFNFLRDYSSRDSIRSRGESLGEEDQRTVVDLLIDQIEFCDVIVLNKTDLITDEERERLMAILRSLNPRARIEIAAFGQVPLDRVLDTGLFDFYEASKAPGWLQELRGTHTPETEEYGIRNFVYRARRPFHPQRFFDWVESEWPGVVRSKGFFWLASDPTLAGNWSQAGAVARHGVAGYWWAAVPQERWPQDPESVALIREKWDENVGDARQELVLIGMGMDEAALRARFDACLLTDEEMAQGPKAWTTWHNPFPDWH